MYVQPKVGLHWHHVPCQCGTATACSSAGCVAGATCPQFGATGYLHIQCTFNVPCKVCKVCKAQEQDCFVLLKPANLPNKQTKTLPRKNRREGQAPCSFLTFSSLFCLLFLFSSFLFFSFFVFSFFAFSFVFFSFLSFLFPFFSISSLSLFFSFFFLLYRFSSLSFLFSSLFFYFFSFFYLRFFISSRQDHAFLFLFFSFFSFFLVFFLFLYLLFLVYSVSSSSLSCIAWNRSPPSNTNAAATAVLQVLWSNRLLV
jgi:hypothetical protein